VSASLNRVKGAKDPGEWLPPDRQYHVRYAEDWVAVKRRWGLTADARELAALQHLLGDGATLPARAAEAVCVARIAPVAPSQRQCGAKRTCGQMNSCAEARSYHTVCGRRRLDGDRDGIPCEKLCR
jgi:hypothetical protein